MRYELTGGSPERESPEFAKLESDWNTVCEELRESKRAADEKYLSPSGLEVVEEKSWFTNYHSAARLGGRRITAAVEGLRRLGYTVRPTRTAGDWEVVDSENVIGTIHRVAPAPLLLRREVARSVFGDASNPHKQYVLDDLGNHTRRFAYCVREKDPDAHRPKRKVEVLNKVDFRTKGDRTHFNRAAALVKAADKRNQWYREQGAVKLFLGYFNYSHQGALGYCLASSPLRIRDNSGKAFADRQGYSLWIIDLALVPATVVLVNLYAQYPSVETVPRHEWVSAGTAKNRECYCSDLPEAAVVKHVSLTEEMVTGSYNWKNLAKIAQKLQRWCEQDNGSD